MKKLRYSSLAVAIMIVVNTVAGSAAVFGVEDNSLEGEILSAEESSDGVSENDLEEDRGETEVEESGSLGAEENSDGEGGESPEETTGAAGSEGVAPGVVGNIVIKSFNPGYADTGEFFELFKLSEEPILLAGLSVIYTTSSGSEYEVYKFPEGSEMVGESLLMRLSSSDEVKETSEPREVADAVYTRNMAQGKGKIELRYTGSEASETEETPVTLDNTKFTNTGSEASETEETLTGEPGFNGVRDPETGTFETLCWGLEDERCYPGFKSSNPTTLVRDFSAEEMGELYQHVSEYSPSYDPEKPGLIFHEVAEEVVEPRCRSLEFSEIFTYFENSAEEQFVEIFNRSEERTELDGCTLKYKNKVYELGGVRVNGVETNGRVGANGSVGANEFLTIYPFREWGLSLTKNPTSANTLEIVDRDGEVVDSLSYFSGQRKGVSLAMFGWTEDGREIWRQTYNPTPGAENVFQEFKSCPVGKVINLETGNCVNETALAPTLAACPEGKYRNPLTGRCKSYATTASAELKPCAEGYERNPETGRCRKIRENDGAEYPVVTEEVKGKREFVAIVAIIVVIVAGVSYIAFQYREEIKRTIRK